MYTLTVVNVSTNRNSLQVMTVNNIHFLIGNVYHC